MHVYIYIYIYTLLDRSDFHMINDLLIAVNAFTSRILMLFSVNETLLTRYANLFTNFREPPFRVERSFFFFK